MKLFAQHKRQPAADDGAALRRRQQQHAYEKQQAMSSLQSQLSPVHLMKSMGSGALLLTQKQQDEEEEEEMFSERVVVMSNRCSGSSNDNKTSNADSSTTIASSSCCSIDEFTAGSTQSGDSFVAIEDSPLSSWTMSGGGHHHQQQQHHLDNSFEDPYLTSRDDILARRRQELHRRGEQPIQQLQQQTPPRFPLPQRRQQQQQRARRVSPVSQTNASPANSKSLGSFQFEPDWTETSNHSLSSSSATDDDNDKNDDSGSSSWLHTTIGTISPIRAKEEEQLLHQRDVSPSPSFSSSNNTSSTITPIKSSQLQSSENSSNLLLPPSRLLFPATKPPVPQETDEVSVRTCWTEQSQDHYRSNAEQQRRACQQVALYESTLHRLTQNNAAATHCSLKRATVLLQLGGAYQTAQQLEMAMQSYTTAASLFRKQARRKPLALATALYKVGVVCSQLLKQQHSSSQEQQQHYFYRARNCLTESLERRLAELGPWHVDTIDTVHALAVLYLIQGDDYATATQYAWQVVWARRAVFGPHHPAVAVAAQTAGKCLFRAGSLTEARHFYDMALEVYNAMDLPNENPAVASLLRQIKRLDRVCNYYCCWQEQQQEQQQKQEMK